ncbi:MAG: sugar phosphate isomerase/epimerase [Lentisphaerae bacterium]|nr:sugar phosphate isomerase/epimerase [Lentisphaerota bacterium]
MMTLGMIENSTEAGFNKVAGFGLKSIEFCYNVGEDPSELLANTSDIKKWSSEKEIKVGAVGRWGTDKIADDGSIIQEELKASRMLIDFCADVGCPVFNTGVNYVEAISFADNCNIAIDFLSELINYGKDKNVKIAVYNCNWNNFIRTPEVWKIILGKLPELGLKYDPSHCINGKSGDYLAELAEWGKRIYHFHIKGTINVNGKHLDDPPAGLDITNWGAVMGCLYAAGYKGMLSIEPHSNVWQDELGDWGIRYTIDYISRMVFTK